MGKELDIDDAAAGHPMAQAYLAGMRAETARLRAENVTFRNAQRACEHCDPAGHDVSVAAERERCAAILKARADKIAAEAERAVKSAPDEVSALRAMAWQLTVAEREIRGPNGANEGL